MTLKDTIESSIPKNEWEKYISRWRKMYGYDANKWVTMHMCILTKMNEMRMLFDAVKRQGIIPVVEPSLYKTSPTITILGINKEYTIDDIFEIEHIKKYDEMIYINNIPLPIWSEYINNYQSEKIFNNDK